MPGNVNINIPPRLIESARAAQYANREALDGRALVGKIKAKAKVERAATVRAKALLVASEGGLLEEGKPDKWKIWKRRRPANDVDGVHYSISIIDEDDGTAATNTNNSDWAVWSDRQIGTTFMKRFILMIPNFTGEYVKQYPSAWPNLAGNPQGNPVGFSFLVARYDQGPASPSDYFALIEEATKIPWSEVKSVFVAVDNSGSMFRSTVTPDLDLFISKLRALNISYAETDMSPSEVWIRSHTS